MGINLLPKVIVGLVVGIGVGIGIAGVVVLSGTLQPRQAEATHGGSPRIHACVSLSTLHVRFKLPGQDATCIPGEFPMEVGSGGAVGSLEARVTALEDQVPDCLSEDGNQDAVFEGCNVRVLSGSGSTIGQVNGEGNLIIGYDENTVGADRSGSHNLVVGPEHSYSNVGGLVAGFRNTVSGAFASASGGAENVASGTGSSISGGILNTASNDLSSVSGGSDNLASGVNSSVSGGQNNVADGDWSSISGGEGHTITVDSPFGNNDHDWIAGSLVEDF